MAPQDQTPDQPAPQQPAPQDAPLTPQQKAEAFIQRIREHDDVTIKSGAIGDDKSNPNFTYAVDPETLKYMLDHKMMVELKNKDLSPAYNMGVEFSDVRNNNQVKPDGHFDVPVYVIPGVGNNTQTSQVLGVIGGKAANGDQEFILVSEGNHDYTAAYYRRYLMPSDADVAAWQNTSKARDFKPETAEQKQRYDALLAYAAKTATKDGISTPRIIISGDPDAKDVYAFDTTDGHRYISISKDALTQALSSGDGMDKLKSSIDSETARIRDGRTTPEGMAADKAIGRETDAFFSSFPTINRKPYLDMNNDVAPVSQAALDRMVQAGDLGKVTKDDLTPQAASNPIFNTKDAHGKDLPIYVVSGMGSDNLDAPKARVEKTKDGKEYILVNEGYHKWTEQYVRDKIMLSDNQIANDNAAVPADDYVSKLTAQAKPEEAADIRRRYQELTDALEQESGAMGIATPKLIADISRGPRDSDASAMLSKEGHGYIVVDKAALEQALHSDASMQQLKAVVAHEAAHLADGDNTPAGAIRSRDMAAARQMEITADLRGSGPLGTHDPESLEKYFERQLAKDLPEYLRAHPGVKISADNMTDQDIKAISDWNEKKFPDHPADWIRIAALKDEAVRMKEYESTHTITTQADREAESQAVIKQVLEDMAPNLKAEAGGPGNTLNPAQKADIATIRQQLGQKPVDAQAATVPTTPVVPKTPAQAQVPQH